MAKLPDIQLENPPKIAESTQKEWERRDSDLSEDLLRDLWFSTYNMVLQQFVVEGFMTLVSMEQREALKKKLAHAADLADQAVISYTEHRILHADVVTDSVEHFHRTTKAK